MRYVIYIRNGSTEQMLYDSEAGSIENGISSPQMKLELNKAGSLEFSIFPAHPLFGAFTKMKTYVRVTQDDDEIFRGRVLQVEDGMYLERKIQCEGDLAYLIDSMQYPDKVDNTAAKSDLTTNNTAARNSVVASQRDKMPAETITVAQVDLSAEKANHETLQNHLIRYLTVHNSQMDADKQFGIGSITVDKKNTEQDFTNTGYRDTKSAIDEDLLKYYGGFLQTRKGGSVVYIDWLKEPGTNASQPIKMGLNMIDLQQQESTSDVFTRLVPVGDNQLTIESVNSGKNYIQNDAGFAKYGAIYKTESFSGVTDPTELKRQGQAFMDTNYKDEPLSLTIKAIDMRLLDGTVEAIRVGTKVTVISEPHDLAIALNVTSIDYDIQNPENTTYEIGDPYETLSNKTKNDKNAASSATKAASTKASRASSAASSLQAAVNRHAASIIDIADKTYTLQADELNITARVISVEADLLQIHARALEITANTVKLTADYAHIGDIIMGGTDYELELLGDTKLSGMLDIGGKCYCEWFEGEFYYQDGMMGNATNLGNAVVSFGTASTSTAGVVSIPYNQANGTKSNITFNMASTAFYKSAVEASWESGGKTAYVSVRNYTSTYGIAATLNPGDKKTVHAWYKNYQGANGTMPVAHDNLPIAVGIEARALSLQDKGTVTSNGTYTPGSGYDGISKIVVNVPTSSTVHSIKIPDVWHANSRGSATLASRITTTVRDNNSGYCMFRVKCNDEAEAVYAIALG